MSKCAAEVPVSVLQVQFTAGVRLQESPAQHSQHVLVQERYACGTPTVCTLHSRLLIMFNNPHCDVCVCQWTSLCRSTWTSCWGLSLQTLWAAVSSNSFISAGSFSFTATVWCDRITCVKDILVLFKRPLNKQAAFVWLWNSFRMICEEVKMFLNEVLIVQSSETHQLMLGGSM